MAKAEERARQLLESNGVNRVPIPVEHLAKTLGIEVRYSPGRPDVSGALIRDGKSAVIAVNSAQHENRQRFTIAHEIGHFLLHKGTTLHLDEDFSVNFRDAHSSEATDDLEISANQFAASLLMPSHLIRKDMTRFISDGSDPEQAIQSLSIKYKVSTRAMEFRLLNLGYISPIAD
jgi:Zn-dependent peptidase ImmA (M78 family)